MKHLCILLLCASIFLQASAQSDKEAILSILQHQSDSWNQGSIDDFMKGYWQSDSLMFIGKNGITYGYADTRDKYQKSYPDAGTRGKLFFDVLKIRKLSNEYYFVVGKWMLKREVGDLSGYYTLLFRKIGGRWYIISDHSS